MLFFVFNETATTEIYTYCHPLSLHDALPICFGCPAHDQRDLDFARKYGLPVAPVLWPEDVRVLSQAEFDILPDRVRALFDDDPIQVLPDLGRVFHVAGKAYIDTELKTYGYALGGLTDRACLSVADAKDVEIGSAHV